MRDAAYAREAARPKRRLRPSARVGFVALAVASALIGTFLTSIRLRYEYREHRTGQMEAFGGAPSELHPAFELFRERVQAGDRWFLAIGAATPDDATAVRVSLYANYLLLPAVRVESPDEATVALAFRAELPASVRTTGVARRGDAAAAEVVPR